MRTICVVSAVTLVVVLACSGEDRPPPLGGSGGHAGGDGDGDGDVGGEGGDDTDTSSGGSGADSSGGSDGYSSGGFEPGVGGSYATECGDVFCNIYATCSEQDDEPMCSCASGLAGDGLRCSDVDECTVTPDICGEQASCVNSFGSYYCLCGQGYIWDGEACVDVNECQLGLCDATANCSDGEGSFSCSCGSGSYGNGFFCKTEDDCASDPCGANGSCVNTPAGYACQCDVGFQGSDDCAACGEELVIADEGLRGAINLQLGRAFDDASPISIASLADETDLDASGYFITDLSGLECWNSLEWLDISNNPLNSAALAPLSTLNRLVELDLDCVDVASLGALSNHPTVRWLSASAYDCGRQLEDASAVGSLAQLEYLDLSGHDLTSVAFLASLKALRSLRLSGNQLADLSALDEMSGVWGLDLGSNSLNDLDGVAGMVSLQSLGVPDNELSSLAPISALTQLVLVNAAGNQLSTLPDLSGLPNLHDLVADMNELTSVERLANLTQLSHASVASNELETLDPLLDGSFRGTLVISDNPLPCSSEGTSIATLRSRGVQILGECQP